MTAPLWIRNQGKINLHYSIPKHLEEITNTEELRSADLELFDSELRAQGTSVEGKKEEGVIWRLGFPGMILDVQGIQVGQKSFDVKFPSQISYNSNGEDIDLYVSPIHPHRADLSFKHDRTLERLINPLTVNGVLEDSQGKVIVGIRGGNVDGGAAAVFPGGHVDYQNPRVRDVTNEVYREGREEAGLLDSEIESIEKLGLMGSTETRGVNILHRIRTNQTYETIKERQKGAEDAFEHKNLYAVGRDKIEELVRTGKFQIGNNTHPTTTYFKDCFEHYLNTRG